MSNDVKVDFDPDPNGNHYRLLEAYFEYIKYYERYIRNPSQYSKRLCRARLYEIQKISKVLRRDLLEVHKTVIHLRQEVFNENQRQREIKKASKGK
jgi:hypothetical protein